jgi:hypothetical protein
VGVKGGRGGEKQLYNRTRHSDLDEVKAMVTKTKHIGKAKRELAKYLMAYETALKNDNRSNRNVEKVRAKYLTLSLLTKGSMKKKNILDKELKVAQSARNVTNKQVIQCLGKLTEAQKIVDSIR